MVIAFTTYACTHDERRQAGDSRCLPSAEWARTLQSTQKHQQQRPPWNPRPDGRAASTMASTMTLDARQRRSAHELPRAAVTSPSECRALPRQSNTIAAPPRRGDGRSANIIRDDFAREARTRRITRDALRLTCTRNYFTQQHGEQFENDFIFEHLFCEGEFF